jgi:glycopeptide antibiotics resistance protein
MLAKDKALHWKVMAIATILLALVLEVWTFAVPLLILLLFHFKLPKREAWQKASMVIILGTAASLAKEIWDAGYLNRWLPTILDKDPLTGFDILDLGFSLLGLLLGLLVYTLYLILKTRMRN